MYSNYQTRWSHYLFVVWENVNVGWYRNRTLLLYKEMWFFFFFGGLKLWETFMITLPSNKYLTCVLILTRDQVPYHSFKRLLVSSHGYYIERKIGSIDFFSLNIYHRLGLCVSLHNIHVMATFWYLNTISLSYNLFDDVILCLTMYIIIIIMTPTLGLNILILIFLK